MNLHRLWAMARKEFLHVRRDPRSLGMAIAIPVLLLALYGYALTLDVDHVPVVIWDQSESPLSREFVSSFSGSRYFSIRGFVRNYQDLERAIDSREALAGLVIPPDFSRQLESGRKAPAQMIVDGSDANTATIALGYGEVLARIFSEGIALRQIRRLTSRAPEPPLELRPRVWFNADLESRNYIIPGLIAIIMMVIAALLTSLTVAREWERGTMEQLIATPVQGRELILGKLIPYFAIGFFDVSLVVLMGEFLFHVPLRGNVALLFGSAAIFLAGALSLGILISVVTRNQLLAQQASMLATYMPGLLLSGFVFAISGMPQALQLFTYLVPARYFVTLLKGIYLKGIGLEILAAEALLLTLFALGVLALACAKFKKKLV